jgi:hypothetical protein
MGQPKPKRIVMEENYASEVEYIDRILPDDDDYVDEEYGDGGQEDETPASEHTMEDNVEEEEEEEEEEEDGNHEESGNDEEDGNDEEGGNDEEDSVEKKPAAPYVPNKTPTRHGTAICQYCQVDFIKQSQNHKVCRDPKCQELKETDRKINKRKNAKLKHDQEKKEEADDAAAKERADQARANLDEQARQKPSAKKVKGRSEEANGRTQKRKASGGQLTSGSPKSRNLAASSNRASAPSKKAKPATRASSPIRHVQRILPNQKGNSVDPSMKLKKSPPQEGNVGATGGSGNKCKITTQPSSTNGPSSDFDRTEAMLKWKKYTNGLLEKGYWVFDLLQDDDAASVNIHCELMDEMVSTPWKSRVRQGWEDGRSLILEEILVPHHKIKNLKNYERLIELGKSALDRISRQMLKVKKDRKEKISQELIDLKGKQILEVSYVSHPVGEHKHEFVHADSVVQGDLMAIMPLTEDAVIPHFFPYGAMEAFKQGPITREDEDYKGGDEEAVRRMIDKMNKRFHNLASTTTGAAVLYAGMEPTEKIRRGDLLVYLGDALHALPAGNRKLPDRFIYFKGRLAGPDTQGGSAKAASEQTETASSGKAADGAGSEVASPDITKKETNDSGGNANPTARSENAGPDTDGGSSKATSMQAKNTGSDKAAGSADSENAVQLIVKENSDSKNEAVLGSSEVPGQGGDNEQPCPTDGIGTADGSTNAASEKKTHDDPDAHGVIDALRVLKYGDGELLDDAALHNLIAAGYSTKEEARKFYKTRYPHADNNQIETFQHRFVEEIRRKVKTTKLDLFKLPVTFDF